jgi:hypothetical protein
VSNVQPRLTREPNGSWGLNSSHVLCMLLLFLEIFLFVFGFFPSPLLLKRFRGLLFVVRFPSLLRDLAFIITSKHRVYILNRSEVKCKNLVMRA